MLNFQNELPEDPRGQSLELMRCPPTRAIEGIITSVDFLGCNTHFYHGRTLPCDDSDCPACLEGLPWYWHSYISLFSIQTHRQVLFESTAKATEPLKLYRQAHGTLRGCLMFAKRANSSPNSHVIIQTKPADLADLNLPPEPNILKVLSIIWNISLDGMKINGIVKGGPALSVQKVHEHEKQPLSLSRNMHLPSNPNGDDLL